MLGADLDELRTLRAVLLLAYATNWRTDDAEALAARYPLPQDPAPE